MSALWLLTLEIPLAKPLPSLANSRMHWRALAELKAQQRHRLALHLRARGAAFMREWTVMRPNESLRLDVTWTRISPRELDDDNNVAAFKTYRDELAKWVGINDRSKRYEWRYSQERGAPAIRIRLEVLQRRES